MVVCTMPSNTRRQIARGGRARVQVLGGSIVQWSRCREGGRRTAVEGVRGVCCPTRELLYCDRVVEDRCSSALFSSRRAGRVEIGFNSGDEKSSNHRCRQKIVYLFISRCR
jgi:hypothetical protein